MQTVKGDVQQLELLNTNLALMQGIHDAQPDRLDVREIAQTVCESLGVRFESAPDPVVLVTNKQLFEFTLRSLISTVAENRPDLGTNELTLRIRSTGTEADLTALLSLKGRNLQLEGILPEPTEDEIPNQGRMSVFLAKEILRLHHGEIHAGPGIEGTEILISLRSW